MSLFSYAGAQGYIRARYSRLLDRGTWARLMAAAIPAELGAIVGRPIVGRDGRIKLGILRGEIADAGSAIARFLPHGAGELVAWYNRRFEIENLKTVLRAVHYGLDPSRALASLIPLRAHRRQALGGADRSRIGRIRYRSNPRISLCPAAGTRHGALSAGAAIVLSGNRPRFVLFPKTGSAHRIAKRDRRRPMRGDSSAAGLRSKTCSGLIDTGSTDG